MGSPKLTLDFIVSNHWGIMDAYGWLMTWRWWMRDLACMGNSANCSFLYSVCPTVLLFHCSSDDMISTKMCVNCKRKDKTSPVHEQSVAAAPKFREKLLIFENYRKFVRSRLFYGTFSLVLDFQLLLNKPAVVRIFLCCLISPFWRRN